MTTSTADPERHALRISIAGSLFMGGLGLGFSVLTKSEAILLDGIFSSVNAVIGFVTLRVAMLVRQPDDERFQFGYASFEPLTNTVKGLVILGVCTFALVAAIGTLRSGGREMEVGWGLLYAVVAMGGCFAIALVQRRAAREARSPLVAVEAKNWTVDGLMSGAVAGAFAISFLIQGGPFDAWIPYVDPLLVIVLSVVALPIPLGIVRQNLGDLLLGAPPVEVRRSLEDRIAVVAERVGVEQAVIRTMRVGRQHYALVHLRVGPDIPAVTIDELDDVRQLVTDELASTEPSWVVDVLFVANERWM